MNPPELRFGVNINNRIPLIAPDYNLADLLDISEVVETAGFDSVWVAVPCTGVGNPGPDVWRQDDPRACMGNLEEGVKHEYAALGLDFSHRARIFEEGLSVLRQLWTEGWVTFQGKHWNYEDISFYSGTEMGPLKPLQSPPPIWVVSNPRLVASKRAEDRVARVINREVLPAFTEA